MVEKFRHSAIIRVPITFKRWRQYTFLHSHLTIQHNCLNCNFNNHHSTKQIGCWRRNLTDEQNYLNTRLLILQNWLIFQHNFDDGRNISSLRYLLLCVEGNIWAINITTRRSASLFGIRFYHFGIVQNQMLMYKCFLGIMKMYLPTTTAQAMLRFR